MTGPVLAIVTPLAKVMTNASQMNQINEVGGLHVSAQYLLLRYI
jgi:hypothetical protein